MTKSQLINVFGIAGIALIGAGAFMVSVPCGLISVGGVLFVSAVIAGVFA